MAVSWFYKRLKINAVFCQVLNNQQDCDFKSVGSNFWYNQQKTNGLEQLLWFLMDANDNWLISREKSLWFLGIIE